MGSRHSVPIGKHALFRWVLALGIAVSACQTAQAAPSPSGLEPGARAIEPLLYVASQEAATISIIDVESNTVIETIDLQSLGFPATSKPHHVVVEPDGSFWYVSLIGANTVLKFNRDNELVGRASFEFPGMLALHPGADMLFVGRSMAAVNPPQRIGAIRRSDMSIEEIETFFPRPHALAVDPRGAHVFTGSLAVNQIAAVDWEAASFELTDVEGAQHVLVQFAVSSDGTRLVATGQLTGKLLVFDTTNPEHPRLIHTVDVNAAPWHPAFSPDGRFLYFGNQGANTVTVVDADTWSVLDVIEGEGLAEPHGIAVSPAGRYVYVSNHNMKGDYHSPSGNDSVGTVVVIDAAAREIVDVIEVGLYGAGMGIGPTR